MRNRQILILYLLAKVEEEDWHGVSDAANDLREYDAFQRATHTRYQGIDKTSRIRTGEMPRSQGHS